MANFKRTRPKWSTACGLCKTYKRFGGNRKLRRKYNEIKSKRLVLAGNLT